MENQALRLPDEGQFRQDLEAINRFQKIVHSNMVPNQDYGIIPGTKKPTLLKPGAEKIAKLLGLSDQYEVLTSAEDWEKPFFRYLIRCNLIHMASDHVVSQGLGECNSMESKYRWRWLFPWDLPEELQGDSNAERDKLPHRPINTQRGKRWQYRLPNDDIYSQVNTILKMAKKRALVDAALSAGRLSNVFTQDIEDLPKDTIQEEIPESEPTAPVPLKGDVPTETKAEEKTEAKPFNPENVGQMFWYAGTKGKNSVEVMIFLGEKNPQNININEAWPKVKKWLKEKSQDGK